MNPSRCVPARRAVASSLIALTLLAPGTSATVAGGVIAPHFVKERGAAGIKHVYDGDWRFLVGAGVAAFDCDDDGRQELYFAGGERPAALYHNDSRPGGALRFSRLRDAATDLSEVAGAYPLDIDGDRIADLAVLTLHGAVLLRGLGDCRFEPANDAWGFDGGEAWTTAFSATWEGDAALPTLAIGTYQELDDRGLPVGGCSDNALVRPDPSGDGYAPPIALSPGWCALSMLFSDWDRSGRRDLRVSNDRHYYRDGEEQLWRIVPGEEPVLYTREDGWEKVQIEGMGIASYDVTGDGFPEVALTSQADSKLHTLADGPDRPTFRNIALELGVETAQPFTGGQALPSTAWHPEFQDVNNDGFIDLLITKGNIDDMADYASKDPTNLLLGTPDGTFEEGAKKAGIVSFERGRGAVLADLNLDGLLDLVKANRRANVEAWRNVGSGTAKKPAAMGSWLGVRLAQAGANPDAIGAWIEVQAGDHTVRREVTVGGGHIGGQLGPTHFGLGAASEAQVRVQWPDGEWGPWLTAAADQVVVIERGASDVSPWTPPGG